MPHKSIEMEETFYIEEVIDWFDKDEWREAFESAFGASFDGASAYKCTSCSTKFALEFASNLDKTKPIHCPICQEVTV